MNTLLVSIAAATALLATPISAKAAGFVKPVAAPAVMVPDANVILAGFKKHGLKRKHGFRSRSHGFRKRSSDRHHFHRNYRAFDRARIYTDGPAVGPSGYRKLRPEFRDGRAFSLFGRRAR